MSSTKWYYQDPATEARAGPVGVQFVRNLLLTQSIEEDTLVWTKGMTDWEPIQNIPIFMTPLERDLKEYYTPGKDQNRHSERDIGLMKQFDEGWYFTDEEGSTHGPIQKTEIVEIIKAAASWDTRVWNVNVLLESELKFRDIFPAEVGKDSSIYEGVGPDQLAQEVQKLEERAHPQTVVPSLENNNTEDDIGRFDDERFDLYPSDSERPQLSGGEEEEEGTSPKDDDFEDPMLSLDSMLLIQKEMQKNNNSKSPTAAAETKEEEPWSSSMSPAKVSGSLKNLLQDAEALLGSVTPKPKPKVRDSPKSLDAAKANKEEEEDEWQLQAVTAEEVKPAFSEAELQSCDFAPGFLSQYISVQRQAFEFRKNLCSKGK